jgi:hypothetical protein
VLRRIFGPEGDELIKGPKKCPVNISSDRIAESVRGRRNFLNHHGGKT